MPLDAAQHVLMQHIQFGDDASAVSYENKVLQVAFPQINAVLYFFCRKHAEGMALNLLWFAKHVVRTSQHAGHLAQLCNPWIVPAL